VCATNSVCTGFSKTEVLNLASLSQILHCARDILDRHVWIDTVLVEEIDYVRLEAFEGRLLTDAEEIPIIAAASVCNQCSSRRCFLICSPRVRGCKQNFWFDLKASKWNHICKYEMRRHRTNYELVPVALSKTA
jgi:hypothetical protein